MGEAVTLRPTERPMPEPSPELWANFCRLSDRAFRHPKAFDREVETTLRVLDAHRQNASLMRARGAEYDEKVAQAREEFANWFDTIVAAIRMQQMGR